MKKYMPIITVVIVIAIIVIIFLSMFSSKQMVVIKEGNIDQNPLEIVLGKYQDSDCGMVIDSLNYASQVIAPDGKTWFFHDHGGMVNWLKDKPFKETAKIWVMSRDSKRYIDGRNAWYTRNEDTPMRYGFGAYEELKDGLISFEEVQLRVLRNETMANPAYKKELIKK
ncbi:hypothetical protein N5912_01010 [Arcobacter lacus]|uniref:hypothetical protein n=1 Tax=Arcobacter lacus TaxID=1912876 RepID=UPI0021BB8592|nr:hypothetical protein [Arcobacter lacus]MCT7910399.1 hypothetical protein [Arcobacter lacus]